MKSPSVPMLQFSTKIPRQTQPTPLPVKSAGMPLECKIRNMLHDKYDSEFHFYLSKSINALVQRRKNKPDTILFADYEFLDTVDEFLKRFYLPEEVQDRILILADYFERTCPLPVQIPFFVSENVRKILYKRVKRRNKVKRKRQQQPDDDKEEVDSQQEFIQSIPTEEIEASSVRESQIEELSFESVLYDVYNPVFDCYQNEENLLPAEILTKSLQQFEKIPNVPTLPLMREDRDYDDDWPEEDGVGHLVCNFNNMNFGRILKEYNQLKQNKLYQGLFIIKQVEKNQKQAVPQNPEQAVRRQTYMRSHTGLSPIGQGPASQAQQSRGSQNRPSIPTKRKYQELYQEIKKKERMKTADSLEGKKDIHYYPKPDHRLMGQHSPHNRNLPETQPNRNYLFNRAASPPQNHIAFHSYQQHNPYINGHYYSPRVNLEYPSLKQNRSPYHNSNCSSESNNILVKYYEQKQQELAARKNQRTQIVGFKVPALNIQENDSVGNHSNFNTDRQSFKSGGQVQNPMISQKDVYNTDRPSFDRDREIHRIMERMKARKEQFANERQYNIQQEISPESHRMINLPHYSQLGAQEVDHKHKLEMLKLKAKELIDQRRNKNTRVPTAYEVRDGLSTGLKIYRSTDALRFV